MATKQDDSCFSSALPDEPLFTLLARDESAPTLVRMWAFQRVMQIRRGEKPETDMAKVDEAYNCATAMEKWRRDNLGAWRNADLHLGLLAGAKE